MADDKSASIVKSAAGLGAALAALLAAVLAGCGGGGGDGGAPDNRAPTAEILFPPARSLTGADSVTVTGTARDASQIAAVRVNGTDATTSDGFAHWRATVALQPGPNILTVETADAFLNTDPAAAQAQIESGLVWLSPTAIALDGDRALVIDTDLKAIVAVDLATGERTVLSDASTPNADNPFVAPVGLVVDSVRNRALVVDTTLRALIAVDLNSGARTVFSDDNTPLGGMNRFSRPTGIVLDGNRALVTDSLLDAVIAVDLVSGARTVLSHNSTPSGPDALLDTPVGIALDPGNNRALVLDSTNTRLVVIAVDLASGARSVRSDATPPNLVPFSSPRGIGVDAENGGALVTNTTESNEAQVIAVRLDDGERNVFSGANTPPDGGALFATPSGIVLDSARNRILVADVAGAVFALDRDTGARTVLSSALTPNTENPFSRPEGVAVDGAGGQLYVVDSIRRAVIVVDRNSGARTILSSPTIPDENVPLDSPTRLAVDNANNRNRLLVIDPELNAVIAVNLATGARSVLSDFDDLFSAPADIAVDPNPTRNRALVLDEGLSGRLIAVDLDDGTQSIVSGPATPPGVDFQLPVAMALDVDGANDRALVVDATLDTLFEVDLNSGARSVISDAGAGQPLEGALGVVLDRANNRVIVLDESNALIAVNLADGTRSVSNIVTPNIRATGIAFDAAANLLFVTDEDLAAVVAVDPAGGQRVIFSR